MYESGVILGRQIVPLIGFKRVFEQRCDGHGAAPERLFNDD